MWIYLRQNDERIDVDILWCEQLGVSQENSIIIQKRKFRHSALAIQTLDNSASTKQVLLSLVALNFLDYNLNIISVTIFFYLIMIYLFKMGRDSSVGIVSRYRLDPPGNESQWNGI